MDANNFVRNHCASYAKRDNLDATPVEGEESGCIWYHWIMKRALMVLVYRYLGILFMALGLCRSGIGDNIKIAVSYLFHGNLYVSYWKGAWRNSYILYSVPDLFFARGHSSHFPPFHPEQAKSSL
jgi:hypothetical protein